MSTPVEASSLSSLTNLFSNPPQYPRNPTHPVHNPLVLYIVRVPGSQDVFLTPLKPPTKASISLEAIQSSLYYFHVSTPEDEEVRRSLDQQCVIQPTQPKVTVARKPLPSIPSSIQPSHERPLPPPTSYPHYQPGTHGLGDTQAERLATRGQNLTLDTNSDNVPQKRPISARIQHGREGTGPHNTLHEPPSDYIVPSNGDHIAPPQRLRPVYNRNYDSADSSPYGRGSSDFEYMQSRSRSPERPLSHTNAQIRSQVDVPAVTVIRRDPASGNQWNIGTISQLPATFSGSTLLPVSIDLTTPGYCRFARQFESPAPRSTMSDPASIKTAIESGLSAEASPSGTPYQDGSFHRAVDYRKLDTPEGRPRRHERINSMEVTMRPGAPGSRDAAIARHVLSFLSPWQGMCTFSNAIDGKSLRCKHTVASTSSTGEGVTQVVSELRFNLGWTIRSKEMAKQTEPEPEKLPIPRLLESKKENFRKSFQHFKHKSVDLYKNKASGNRQDDLNPYSPVHVTSDVETLNTNARARPRQTFEVERNSNDEDLTDDEHRISLKLGREKAGGGYRGNSAKLGKLIIEDEGLKMADLLVAANMGIWFQYWWKER